MAGCALVLGCGEFLSFEAEAPNACVTISGVHVPGLDEVPVPRTLPVPKATVTQSFDVPIDQSVLPTGSSARISLVSFELLAPTGVSFDFVDSLQLSAMASGVEHPLTRYDKSAAVGNSLALRPSPAPEVTPYITNGVLTLQGTLTASLPDHGFDVQAIACFDVAANIGKVQ